MFHPFENRCKQLMPAYTIGGVTVPANPYDARQMVDYLAASPSESRLLNKTLNIELTPVYALEPQGAYARDVYSLLFELLAGQIQAETSEEYVERVSIPGVLTGRTVKLFSKTGSAVDCTAKPAWDVWLEDQVRWSVRRSRRCKRRWAMLKKMPSGARWVVSSTGSTTIYATWALRLNIGRWNFAATNAFFAATTFASAVATGMELDSITVEKSPLRSVG